MAKAKASTKKFSLFFRRATTKAPRYRRLGIPDFDSQLDATLFFQDALNRDPNRSIRPVKPGYLPPRPVNSTTIRKERPTTIG